MKKKLLSRKAFTLIELLVVITIIGILASLAIPTIGSAIAQANQTKDLNNITQTGRTLFMDANDNGGTYRKEMTGGGDYGKSSDMFKDLLNDGALTTATVLLGTGLKPAADVATIASDNVAWAYVVGLKTSSNPNIPLLLSYGSGFVIPTGLTADTPLDISGLVEGDPSDGGALWADKCVLAYYVGGNAKILKPGKDGLDKGEVKVVEQKLAAAPAGIELLEP